MISRKFIQSSIIYTIAGALPMANAVLLLPFYLHYLPADQYGALALYLSFGILVQIIVTYSFDASLYLYFHEYRNDHRKLSQYVSSAFTFVMLLALVVGLVLMLGGQWLFSTFFESVDFYPYGFYSVIASVFQSVFKVNNSFLQSREQPNAFLWSNLVSFSLVAIFTILGLKLYPGTLMGPVAGRMVAFAVSGLWVLYRIYREFGWHLNLSLLRESRSYNNYQFIYQLQQWVINYFDRPIMATLLTMTALGVYDFTVKCLLILDFVISALYNSFLPRILSRTAGQRVNNTSVEINRYYNGLTAAIMMMVSGSILVLPLLITWFVKKPGYADSIYLVPFASLVFLLRGLRFYFGLPYNLKKYNKPFPIIFLIVSAAKIFISYVLIKRYEAIGAVAATVLCSALEIVLVWSWMRKDFQYTFNVYKILVAPLALGAMVLILEPWIGSYYPVAVHAGYVAVTAASLVWLYRKELPLLNVRKILKG